MRATILFGMVFFGTTTSFTPVAKTSTLQLPVVLQQRLPRLPRYSQCYSSSTSSGITKTASTKVATAPNVSTSRSYLDDGFVFGLEGSGIDRPKGKVPQIVVEGDSLETQPWQVITVWGTLAFHTALAFFSLTEMVAVNSGNTIVTLIQAAILFLSSYVLADFGSGVLHWSVDNYGNGRTPIMGGIIAAFQGHHSAPWTITQRGFSNNVYKLCIPFGIIPISVISLISGPFTTFFITIFCLLEILSQEFHKWSHMTKNECPNWVNTLQQMGLTISRKPHAQHHLAPFEGNYCIISGVCNTALDKSGFFRRLEHLVYKWNGVESNAWKLDPELKERTLKGDYSLVVGKSSKGIVSVR